MTFENIKQVNIPLEIIQRTIAFLQENGLEGTESHCLWVGISRNTSFIVKEIIFPKQTKSAFSFMVSAEELDRINRELYNKKLELIAQVHSHPGKAFHSHTDNKFPVVTTLGGFSLVFPYYGQTSKNDLKKCSIYLLTLYGWIKINKTEKKLIFKILE